MPHGDDDPRQVLAILNSLGFVGITAEQLKSFMKDLKLHRKIKERQREQWQEETKKKIFLKQRKALAELIDINTNDNSQANSTANDSPVVKIKIKCKTESDDEIENDEEYARVFRREKSQSPPKRQSKKKEIDLGARSKNVRTEVSERKEKLIANRAETVKIIPERTASAPELSQNIPRSRSRSKSVTSNPSSRRNPSRSSSRSQSKSFIRPWGLHPQVQRSSQYIKSDPVSLYQQYQKGWKQKLLPGENRHAAIRWAVREKMLGTDPTPRPVLTKSCSSMSVKRR